jgi:putative membrane protein
MERTYWAAERTLMGWIRTALSMISFGFTIGKLGQTLQEIQVTGLRGMHMIGIDSIAYFLVMLGTGALLAAAVQYSRRVHELCKQGLRRQASVAFWVALVLSLMGIVAFGTLVLNV